MVLEFFIFENVMVLELGLRHAWTTHLKECWKLTDKWSLAWAITKGYGVRGQIPFPCRVSQRLMGVSHIRAMIGSAQTNQWLWPRVKQCNINRGPGFLSYGLQRNSSSNTSSSWSKEGARSTRRPPPFFPNSGIGVWLVSFASWRPALPQIQTTTSTSHACPYSTTNGGTSRSMFYWMLLMWSID